MSRYYNYLREVSSNPNNLDFCSLPLINKAYAYFLLIETDIAWMEEVLIGEGSDSTAFLDLLSTYLLEFRTESDLMVMIQSLFFNLCNDYMEVKVTDDFNRLKQSALN